MNATVSGEVMDVPLKQVVGLVLLVLGVVAAALRRTVEASVLCSAGAALLVL